MSNQNANIDNSSIVNNMKPNDAAGKGRATKLTNLKILDLVKSFDHPRAKYLLD